MTRTEHMIDFGLSLSEQRGSVNVVELSLFSL